ncbi:MAG: YihY/virulence factor BrkB family protein [Saccharofermentanales bacterium]
MRGIDKDRIKEIFKRFYDHQITVFSAQMAFFLFLAIFPFIIFILSLTSILNLDMNTFITILHNTFPPEVSDMITDLINNYIFTGNIGLLLISGSFTLWAVSKSVYALIRSFNVAYGFKENRSYIKFRLMGFLYTLILIFSIIVTIALPTIGDGFFTFLSRFFVFPPYFEQVFYLIRVVLNIAVYAFFILLIHKELPAGKLKYKEIMYGTLFSIIGWFVLSRGFNFFVALFTGYALVYGALASFVILMMWMYFVSTVMMLGAEINSTIICCINRIFPFDRNIFKKSRSSHLMSKINGKIKFDRK